MPKFTVSGQTIELERDAVERTLAHVLPEPLREHYVVVSSRRYPPKQVLSEVTGLDRADFTTHQARRILKRLGFTAGSQPAGHRSSWTHLRATATGLMGDVRHRRWRHMRASGSRLGGPTEVLVAADTPQDVLRWLARHERKATGGMLRVPTNQSAAEGVAPQ